MMKTTPSSVIMGGTFGAGSQAVFQCCPKRARQSGLDIASHPQLSSRSVGNTWSRLSPASMSSRVRTFNWVRPGSNNADSRTSQKLGPMPRVHPPSACSGVKLQVIVTPLLSGRGFCALWGVGAQKVFGAETGLRNWFPEESLNPEEVPIQHVHGHDAAVGAQAEINERIVQHLVASDERIEVKVHQGALETA